jgi:hypothetical protein
MLGESEAKRTSNHTENTREFHSEYAGIFPKGSVERPNFSGVTIAGRCSGESDPVASPDKR